MIRPILITVVCSFFLANTTLAQSYNTDKLLTHKITVNYPDHMVVAFLNPVASVSVSSDRVYAWVSGNQIKETQGGYSGKLLNGDYQDFYLNRNLKESGSYVKGLKDGMWKSWNEQGILIVEFTWSMGQKNGAYAKYDAAGRLTEKGKYHSGLLTGKQEIFSPLLMGNADSAKNIDPMQKNADSLENTKVLHYKKGKQVQPKSIVPGFIKRRFKRKK